MKENYLLQTLLLLGGKQIDSVLEGTCFLYELGGNEYVVLQDNTVITREEDLLNDPLFPV